MITTPPRKAELVSSIFTWSIWSFPCSLLPIDWCRISSNKNSLLKLCFEEVFLQVARLVVAQMLERKWYAPERCGKKTIQILLEWQMTGCWHFLLNLCVVWLSQVAQGPSVPPPPSVPEARWLRGGCHLPTSFGGQLVLPLLPFIQKPCSSHSSHIWAWMDSIWDCAKYCPHKQFARLRSDGRFYVLQPWNRLHSNPPFWGRIPVVWPLPVESSISPAAKCSLTFFFWNESQIIGSSQFLYRYFYLPNSRNLLIISLSLDLFIYLSIYESIYLSIHPSIYLSIYLCMYLILLV